jgi:hypothetical protein
MRLAVHIVLSLVLAVVLLGVWMNVAAQLGWWPFDPSSLWYGEWIVAIPLCVVAASVVVFFGARVLEQRWKTAVRRSQRHW